MSQTRTDWYKVNAELQAIARALGLRTPVRGMNLARETDAVEVSLRASTDEPVTRESIADLLRLLGKAESQNTH